MTGITLPITKHNYLVTRADEIAEVISEAFYIARSGRPGPVLIDICKNAQVESCEFVYPEDVKLPGYQPVTRSPRNLLDGAVALIDKARKPIILCGHGVLMSKAAVNSTSKTSDADARAIAVYLKDLPAGAP